MKFIVQEGDTEYEFLLSPGLYIVGRDPTCDLTLDSQRVSRRHMSCTVTEDHVTVKDLGSRNSIRIGGVKVDEATLRDGDELHVADVRLKFKGDAGGASAIPANKKDEPVEAHEAVLENDEETPPEGALVPEEEGGKKPEVTQKDGRWFVTDPNTGREVEIVPAGEEKTGKKSKSLLSTTKGKIIIGGLAVVVIGLFVAVGLTSGPPENSGLSLNRQQFNREIAFALKALRNGDSKKASHHASRILKTRPNSEVGEVLGALAENWGPYQENFFEQWMDMKELLEDLKMSHSNREVSNFVTDYQSEIARVLADDKKAKEAEKNYEEGDFESAWQKLVEVPENSPVREKYAELFRKVHEDFLTRIQRRIDAAVGRENWKTALKWSEKLGKYYPDKKQEAEEKKEEFDQYILHAELIEKAVNAIEEGNYKEAVQALRQVPQESACYQRAQRLLASAEQGNELKIADDFYDGGNARKALEVLQKLESPLARARARDIETAFETYQAAEKAEAEKDLVTAEQKWNELQNQVDDRDNYYCRQADNALDSIDVRRAKRAEEMLAQGRAALQKDEFERSRDLFEKARRMDPNEELGIEALKRLQKQGRKVYNLAMNEIDENPKGAMQKLEQAMRMLAHDDPFYRLAQDAKEELEGQFK